MELNFKMKLQKLRIIIIRIEDGIFIYKLKKPIHGLSVQMKSIISITSKIGDSNDCQLTN
jgi:hypothetical protein